MTLFNLVYALPIPPTTLHTFSPPDICSRSVPGLLLSPSALSQDCAIDNTPDFVQILEIRSEIMVKLTTGWTNKCKGFLLLFFFSPAELVLTILGKERIIPPVKTKPDHWARWQLMSHTPPAVNSGHEGPSEQRITYFPKFVQTNEKKQLITFFLQKLNLVPCKTQRAQTWASRSAGKLPVLWQRQWFLSVFLWLSFICTINWPIYCIENVIKWWKMPPTL